MGVDVCGQKNEGPFFGTLMAPMANKKTSVRKAAKDGGTRMMIHQRVHNVFFLSEESNSWLKFDNGWKLYHPGD